MKMKKLMTICIAASIFALSGVQCIASSNSETIKTVDSKNIIKLASTLNINPDDIISVNTYYADKYNTKIIPQYTASFISPYTTKIKSGPVESWGIYPINKDYASGGPYGASYSETFEETVESGYSFNASAGIELNIASLEAQVGFNVNSSKTISKSYDTYIPAYKSLYVRVYPIYDTYSYDAYYENRIIGGGSASRPIGLGIIATKK